MKNHYPSLVGMHVVSCRNVRLISWLGKCRTPISTFSATGTVIMGKAFNRSSFMGEISRRTQQRRPGISGLDGASHRLPRGIRFGTLCE